MPNTNTTSSPSCPRWVFVSAAIALLVAAGGATMLTISRFVGMWLPGCGPGGGCDQAADSFWGSLPGLGWPTSSIGLAYFIAMLVAWIVSRGAPPPTFRWIARFGAAMSIVFLIAMGVGGYFCSYCLICHLANFVFVGLAELSRRTAPARMSVFASAAITFLVVTGVLFAFEVIQADVIEQRAEEALAESTANIDVTGDQGGFRGRYIKGPTNAPIRVVVFSDYQCTDCKKIEGDLMRILDERDDVSLSVKHFPFCPACNNHIKKNIHPNACWAARAAETAGILGGDEGFFRMHEWLFEQGGSFDVETLRAGVAQLGFEPHEFLAIMQDEKQTLPQIYADADEGKSLGLHYTPMIFVNGNELKGFLAPNAVQRMIDKVAAENPQPAVASADRPPTAEEKYVADWRERPVMRTPPDKQSWPVGPADAPVRIELYSDLTEPLTDEIMAIIGALMAQRSDIRFDFRHFPVNQACNPEVPRTVRQDGCLAAQAVEAAGLLGGTETYWLMLDWVVQNRGQLSMASIRAAAPAMGLDPDALQAMMQSPQVAQGIAADARAGKRQRLRGIPAVVVNEKFVPRWKLQGADIMGTIVQEAGGG
jgi:protein-disulfide isomerase